MDSPSERSAPCYKIGRISPLCFFHMSIALMYSVGLYGYTEVSRKAFTGAPEEYAGFWKYLTYLNLIFHFLFFAISSIIDIMTPDCYAYRRILKIRDTVFAGIVFPYGVFVFVMFWGIYIGDRDGIVPKVDEKVFPNWLNHISHTVELPVVLLEAFIVHHRYPSRAEGYGLTALFGGAYLLWLLYLSVVQDLWVYIFLKEFSWLGRAIFFIVSTIITFIMYVVGEKINSFFWGTSRYQACIKE